MIRRPTRFVPAALAVLLVTTLAHAGVARAGEFHVAACQADRVNFSTAAFGEFATRGMDVRRACDPEGMGLRGLVTSNVIRRTPVARGSSALVSINAPEGTRFTTFRWAGTARRRDCRYALQLYADAPGVKPVSIKNVRANRNCPPARRSQAAGYRSRTFNVQGTSRIVQRVACVGGQGRKSCSAAGANYIRTYEAEVGIVDTQPPAVGLIGDTALGRGEWVRGDQQLSYTASDNVGVRAVQAMVEGQVSGSDDRPCQRSAGDNFSQLVPCPNGPDSFAVDTRRLPEGTRALSLQAQDSAGNARTSTPIPVRIDNTAPTRVETAVDGGDGWRKANDFSIAWTNGDEGDRSPIAAAVYKVCPAAGGQCVTGEQAGAGVARVGLKVPGSGEWTAALWRRDAAGNESPDAASVPVRLRFDPDAPKLSFENPEAADPTRVSVAVSDDVSGVGDGAIEISRQGSDTWQGLPVTREGNRMTARLDDTSLPSGTYALRARAFDLARNEASTDRRADGQPMLVTLPLRIQAVLRSGVPGTKHVTTTITSRGKKRKVTKRVPTLRNLVRIRQGRRAQISGRLTNRDGQGLGGTEIQVYAHSPLEAEQLVAVARPRADGRFGYALPATTNRVFSFRFAGTSTVLPASAEVRIAVPARTTINVNRKRVLNGQRVRFMGRLGTLPTPARGKLVELQVRLARGWETFRTVRSDAAGRWELPYRFTRTRGVQKFLFRARVPTEAGYAYVTGRSHTVSVRVRGR